jgi:hypothetical protein
MMTKLLEKKKRPTSVVVGPNTETTDYHGVQELFGIRRGLAYHLWEIGAIKSISLKEPGERRGKRLFVVPSIREYLNSKLSNDLAAPVTRTEASNLKRGEK